MGKRAVDDRGAARARKLLTEGFPAMCEGGLPADMIAAIASVEPVAGGGGHEERMNGG